MTQHDEQNMNPEGESEVQNHEVPHSENEPSVPVKPQPHRFTPPIHGNKFGGTQNFRGNNQRPGRAAQRGR